MEYVCARTVEVAFKWHRYSVSKWNVWFSECGFRLFIYFIFFSIFLFCPSRIDAVMQLFQPVSIQLFALFGRDELLNSSTLCVTIDEKKNIKDASTASSIFSRLIFLIFFSFFFICLIDILTINSFCSFLLLFQIHFLFSFSFILKSFRFHFETSSHWYWERINYWVMFEKNSFFFVIDSIVVLCFFIIHFVCEFCRKWILYEVCVCVCGTYILSYQIPIWWFDLIFVHNLWWENCTNANEMKCNLIWVVLVFHLIFRCENLIN